MKQFTTTLSVLMFSLLASPVWSETVTIDDLVERNGIHYKNFTNVPFSGLVVQDCPEGKPKDIFQKGFSGRIVNGLREDYWIITSCLSSRIQRGNYSKGQRVDEWEFYYGDGQLERIGSFKNDSSYGVWKFYDKWGRLVTESTYDEVELVFQKIYDVNEKLVSMGPYKNGNPVGTWKFFKNGQLDKTIEYE